MFRSPILAAFMPWHSERQQGNSTASQGMRDVYDATGLWREVFVRYPLIASASAADHNSKGCAGRKIAFSLCVDGVMPVKRGTLGYRPIMLQALKNLFPWLRLKVSNMFMCCVVDDDVAEGDNHTYHQRSHEFSGISRSLCGASCGADPRISGFHHTGGAQHGSTERFL